MEKLDLVKVGEDGQAYFDFDSLALITSSEFVAEIKDYLERYEEASIFSVIQNKWNDVEVLISNFGRVALFEYSAPIGSIHITYFHHEKLQRIANAMGGFEVTRNV